jgi:hypothetical protein
LTAVVVEQLSQAGQRVAAGFVIDVGVDLYSSVVLILVAFSSQTFGMMPNGCADVARSLRPAVFLGRVHATCRARRFACSSRAAGTAPWRAAEDRHGAPRPADGRAAAFAAPRHRTIAG